MEWGRERKREIGWREREIGRCRAEARERLQGERNRKVGEKKGDWREGEREGGGNKKAWKEKERKRETERMGRVREN